MKASDIVENVIGCDQCTKRNGVFTARKGFFYTHGMTAEKFAESILKFVPEAKVIETDEIWKPFIGGAPIARQSHFLVKFEVV